MFFLLMQNLHMMCHSILLYRDIFLLPPGSIETPASGRYLLSPQYT